MSGCPGFNGRQLADAARRRAEPEGAVHDRLRGERRHARVPRRRHGDGHEAVLDRRSRRSYPADGRTPVASRRLASSRSSFASPRQFSTLPFGTPPLRAISTPQRARSSSSTECASGLIENMQPSSSAAGGASASPGRAATGFALISTATRAPRARPAAPPRCRPVARPPQKLPSRHVAEDRRERVGHRPQDPLGLRGLVQPETAMHAGDDEIEAGEHVVRIVERTVGSRMSALDPLQDAETPRHRPLVQPVHSPHAAPSMSSSFQPARVVRCSGSGPTPRNTRSHGPQPLPPSPPACLPPSRERRVRVQDAAQVPRLDRIGALQQQSHPRLQTHQPDR